MFRLFSDNKPIQCPIDQDMRLWMENAFLFLATQIGHEEVRNKKMLVPTKNDFPVIYDGSLHSLNSTAGIVAAQMDLDIQIINIQTYKQNIQEFEGGLGHRIYTEADKTSDEKLSSGLYFGKNEEGKFDIFIEQKNLSDPENLVATLAHEFAHIKLLGEERIEENDEWLTDLATVVYGLGIFNANSAFKQFTAFDSWGHNSVGYMKQQEWGYALALHAHFREEADPVWVKFLNRNIQSDLKKSQAYIQANIDKVFREEYKGPDYNDQQIIDE